MSVDDIDFSDADAVFDLLWRTVTKKVDYGSPGSDPTTFPDGPIDWNEVRQILNKVSDESIQKTISEMARKDNNITAFSKPTYTILHAICARQPPSDVIDTVLHYNTTIITETDDYQMIPLHWACNSRSSLRVVQSLLHADETEHKTTTTTKGSTYGYTPLHDACYYNAPMEVIRYLMENGPANQINEFENYLGETAWDYLSEERKQSLFSNVKESNPTAYDSGGVNDSDSKGSDHLGYELYAKALVNHVLTVQKQGDEPICVGLYAPWGAGKSFLWNLIQQEFKTKNTEKIDEREEKKE